MKSKKASIMVAVVLGLGVFSTSTAYGVGLANADKKYTMKQVSKHKSTSDCWMVVDKKVYNMTKYAHPEGSIKKYCGKDVTKTFKKEHKGSDLKEAWAVLTGKRVGRV